MRKFILTSTLLCCCVFLCAQGSDLGAFNKERLERQRISMIVLGGWAVGNIAVGASLYGNRQGEDRYFHLMNMGWGVINLGLATAGYLSAVNTDPTSLDLYQSVQAQHNLQKILLLNTGLDVGYVLGGLYLIERSKTRGKKPERLKGFGRSIILQGAFLFAFDLGAYFIQTSQNSKLRPLLSNFYFDGQQLGVAINF